jgi:hypothetical protein
MKSRVNTGGVGTIESGYLQLKNAYFGDGCWVDIYQGRESDSGDPTTGKASTSLMIRAYNGTAYISQVLCLSPNAGTLSSYSFTATHQCQYLGDLSSCLGMIVESTGNIIGGASLGNLKYGIQENELSNAIPQVELCHQRKSKKILGVIAGISLGIDKSILPIQTIEEWESGDFRVLVNSIGEGLVWVVNTNGIIENGDLITSSSIAGYGEKQDDDIIRSYTLGKATMDCDFIQEPIFEKKIKKDLDGNNILDSRGCLIWEDDLSTTKDKYIMRELPDGTKAVLISIIYYSG